MVKKLPRKKRKREVKDTRKYATQWEREKWVSEREREKREREHERARERAMETDSEWAREIKRDRGIDMEMNFSHKFNTCWMCMCASGCVYRVYIMSFHIISAAANELRNSKVRPCKQPVEWFPPSCASKALSRTPSVKCYCKDKLLSLTILLIFALPSCG
jgi:hypothetical protein